VAFCGSGMVSLSAKYGTLELKLLGYWAEERQVMEEKIASMQLSAQDTSREELVP